MLKITKKSVEKLVDVLLKMVEDPTVGNNQVFVISKRVSGMYDIELINTQKALTKSNKYLTLGNRTVDYMISVLDSLDRYTINIDYLKRSLEQIVVQDIADLGLTVEDNSITVIQ